jgi:hypothetical protein
MTYRFTPTLADIKQGILKTPDGYAKAQFLYPIDAKDIQRRKDRAA